MMSLVKRYASSAVVVVDLTTTFTTFALWTASFQANFSTAIDILLLKSGYSFFTSPFDIYLLAVIRSMLLLTASHKFFYRYRWAKQLNKMNYLLMSTTYSFTIIKLLAFSDREEQMTYPGVYLTIGWSLLATFLVGVVTKKAIQDQKAKLSGTYVHLDETEAESEEADAEEQEEHNIAADLKSRIPFRHIVGFMVNYVSREKMLYGIGLFFSVVYGAVRALVPYAVGSVIATIIKMPSLEGMMQSEVRLVGLALTLVVLGGLRYGFLDYATTKVCIHIQTDLFSSIVRQEIGFFDSTKSGSILSRISSDCAAMTHSVTSHLNIVIRNSVVVTGSLVIMMSMSWRLTMVSFIVLPMSSWILYITGVWFDALSEKKQTAISKTNQIAEEVISTMRTVRSFACELFETKRFDDALDKTMKIAKKRAILYLSYDSSEEFVEELSFIVVLFYGGYLVATGKMASDLLVTFLLYQMEVEMNMSNLTYMQASLLESVGASRKVFEYIKRDPVFTNHGNLKPEAIGQIEFKDVHFHYPSRPNQKVLKGLNLTFEAGKTIALVGPSGGGKSSIVSLIEHFYEPQEGSITLDGIPIQDIAHDYYHQKIALVAQEPVLYDGSVRYNITYGCEFATEEMMLNAAKMANVHSFVMDMEKGYDTKCGEKGVQMSGGQKQRIAIARALVRQPTVLILDEATSALDSESESLVQDAIDKCCHDRTVIIIAHRLSTVEKADKIVVLDKGTVQQQGTHKELVNDKDGLYYKLVSKQMVTEE